MFRRIFRNNSAVPLEHSYLSREHLVVVKIFSSVDRLSMREILGIVCEDICIQIARAVVSISNQHRLFAFQ